MPATMTVVALGLVVVLLAFPMYYQHGTESSLDKRCPQYVYRNCPCNKMNVIVKLAACIEKNHRTGKYECVPCNQDFFDGDVCTKFKYCRKCVHGYNKCYSCPAGRWGRFCDMLTSNILTKKLFPSWKKSNNPWFYPIEVQIDVGQPPRANRLLRSTTCEFPEKSDTSEIRCTIWSDRVKCLQTCVWGYTLQGGSTQELICDLDDNVWKPGNFQECQPYVNCEVKMLYPGSLNCVSNLITSPAYCEIQCETYDHLVGTVLQNYTCRLDGHYYPQLPFCVERVADIELAEKPNH